MCVGVLTVGLCSWGHRSATDVCGASSVRSRAFQRWLASVSIPMVDRLDIGVRSDGAAEPVVVRWSVLETPIQDDEFAGDLRQLTTTMQHSMTERG
jgi:hypothetical protein